MSSVYPYLTPINTNQIETIVMSELIPLIIISLLLFFIIKNRKWFSRGAKGERTVTEILHSLGLHYIVLNDLLIQGVHGDSQIDHVVISPYGIFVIETKCWSGWISGSENSYQWKQTIYKEKFDKPNPIYQNKVHVDAITYALKQYGDIYVIPIVVIVDCDRLIVKTPNHTVIRTNALKSEVLKYSRIIYTDAQCEAMAHSLQGLSSDDKERRNQHIQKVQTYQAISQVKVENGICPRCGGTLVLRNGRYGSFYGCSNYPICKFISNNHI